MTTVVLCVSPPGSHCALSLIEQWEYIADEDGVFRPWSSNVILHRGFTMTVDGSEYKSIGVPQQRAIVMQEKSGDTLLVKLPMRVVSLGLIGIQKQVNPLKKITTWNLYGRT